MASLYRYQQQVYDTLMRGKNVILQAPTGAGKTRAALYPFLATLNQHSEQAAPTAMALPLTCRYAVPMRVLANQFEREYRRYVTQLDEVRGTRMRDRYTQKLGVKVPAIQTGETQDDRAFESPLTFCTIDQLLSSFIGTPYSLGSRQANMNVGAVVGSYLILDEFHLYPLDSASGARTTALMMLQLLKSVSRFVLMTATFSGELLEKLASLLDAEVVRVTDEDDLREIMGTRSRTIRLSPTILAPDAVLAAHDAARARGAGASLVICNTVARAQEMYTGLRDALMAAGKLSSTRLELLHSRYTERDRRAKRIRLEWWLGKRRWRAGAFQGPDTIVVATQVVEVGLNISSGVLHTELAPANSLVQRMGRCARFTDQRGEVVVYHPLATASQEEPPRPLADLGEKDSSTDDAARTARTNRLYLPYPRERSEATWQHLAARFAEDASRPLPFGFNDEQRLIDAVHTAEDLQMVKQFREREVAIEDQVKTALRTHEFGAGAGLIRDVRNVSVVIHDEPTKEITIAPFGWDAFQLRPGTLRGAWDALNQRRAALDLPWVMQKLLEDPSIPAESDNSRTIRYTWKCVTNPAEIDGALRLALPPALAAYDEALGFRLLLDDQAQPTGWRSMQHAAEKTKHRSFGGKQGSYVEHITGLMGAYTWSVRREIAWVADRLEEALALPRGSVDEAVRLAIACHDIGKLTRDWQGWAHGWQAKLVERYGARYTVQPGREFLAKTDRADDWKEERVLQQELRLKRPNHACAGVIAARHLIATRLVARATDSGGNVSPAVAALGLATLSAIARHHAPTAVEYDAAAWESSASGPIAAALAACQLPTALDGLALASVAAGKLPDAHLITPDFDSSTKKLTTWLAFVIVRALRLCDQRAEKEW